MTDFSDLIQADRGQDAADIHLVTKATLEERLKSLSAGQRASLAAQRFEGSPNQVGIVPDGDGVFVLGGVADTQALTSYCLAALAEKLPADTYRLVDAQPGAGLFGWLTAQYRFTRYREEENAIGPRVLLTEQVGRIEAALAEALAEMKVRDLVNTPAEDMGPAALETEFEKLAKAHGAKLEVTKGDALETGYPMVHAVGRAAARHHAPRIMHLTWESSGASKDTPVIAIIGKGVCFDSGGLDIKPAAGMRLMKKDMGGAAHAIALAGLVMGANLPVRLHLLVPAVENAIAGSAFRPGDVLASRKGLSVEIHNTDAEGRLILGDALTRASEEEPELVVDFATLTGAARVALGPDYAAMMARRDETADELTALGREVEDEVWRLPLPEAYREYLASDIADMTNAPSNPYAGASVAGLFLDRFVADGIDWVHFDTFAWRPYPKPGRAKGGTAYGLRATWRLLKHRYARQG
ncbi:MAG: leucyl aminopeptidase family protein [Pseudomonadota bacterium]